MKILALYFQTIRFLKNALKNYFFWPDDLHMQLIRTIWTILVGDHPGIIPVDFCQIPISGSREEVVWSFPYIIPCKIVTPGRVKFNPRGII